MSFALYVNENEKKRKNCVVTELVLLSRKVSAKKPGWPLSRGNQAFV